MNKNNNLEIKESIRDTLPDKVPHKHISASDLVRLGYTFEVQVEPDGYQLKSVHYCGEPMDLGVFCSALSCLGLDYTSGVYVEAVFHRPIQTNIPIMGYRFGGLERSDSAWIDSEFASYEAKILSSNMSDMADTLAGMSIPLSDATEKMAQRYYLKNKKRKK